MNHAIQRPGAHRLWWLYAAAAATFLPAIGFHYVGEEAIFPISSLEMWYRGEWVQQTIYGAQVQHTPLFNWLIILLSGTLGWEHVLGVARAIVIAATCLTGLVVAGLALALFADRALAAFAGLIYLTLADVFFYRGWLAYVDPLFALFVAAAVASLWAGCHSRRPAWLWAAVAALTLALLTKAITAYVFYGLAALVLLRANRGYREFLLSPVSWLAHASAAALALAWFYLVPGAGGQGSRLLADVLAKLSFHDPFAYLLKLVAFPAETLLRLAPALFIALVYLWLRRANLGAAGASHARAALWIAGINFVPYWLAPQSAVRYLMPIYPFAALAAAWVIWRAGERAIAVTRYWLVAVIALKLVAVGAFPYYQQHYRGAGYETAARQILERTAGHPLYATNDSASGLSVVAHIDLLRLPLPPLTFPPAQWDAGFVIAHKPEPTLGRVARQYRLGGSDLYLLCRGAGCGTGSR